MRAGEGMMGTQLKVPAARVRNPLVNSLTFTNLRLFYLLSQKVDRRLIELQVECGVKESFASDVFL